MNVWTTSQLNELLRITELPLRLEQPDKIKDLFLAQSGSEDIGVFGLTDDHLTFLKAAREHGIDGPFLLISPEPTIVAGDLHRYNALVLDLKRMGLGEVRNVVHMVIKLAADRANGKTQTVKQEASSDQETDDQFIQDVLAIHERLDHVRKKELPVIVAFQAREQGESVTARGSCAIKQVRNNEVILHRFKQSHFQRVMKKDMPVTISFSYKHKNHGSSVTILQASDQEISVSVPTRLFINREIRIQPTPIKPIGLYVNIPNEPTTQFKVIDISSRGIGFLCSRDLPIDGVYSLTIMLPDPSAVVVTSGTIRFKKETSNGIRYGAEIKTHPWDAENIAKYVMKREAEIIGLFRNG